MTRIIEKVEKEEARRKLFGLLIFSAILMISLYMYFMSVTVIKTVERKENIMIIQGLNSDNQALEESYFSILNKFNKDYAYSLGFVDQKNTDFVFKSGSVAKR
ncbi:MAG: hypothetical protein AAB491_01715 [Patescibacteria group bacterium]